MFDLLLQHIQEKVCLSVEEKKCLQEYFTFKKVRKRQCLWQEGEVCKTMAFISQGLLRSYFIDEKGSEHISFIGWEGYWIADAYSFFTGEVGELTIEALEEAELLLITKENYERLVTNIPAMNTYFRLLYERSLAKKDQRILMTIACNAEQRYEELIAAYPGLAQRIPQHLVAAYLGITPETLSRVKKKMK